MPEGWVFDSSPLIVLGKIQSLELLTRLPGTTIVPKSVVAELIAGPALDPARRWIASRGCRAKKPSVKVDGRVARWDLGPGESAVISLAQSRPRHTAILDDRQARACAASLGVRFKGTLGLLLWMRQNGAIALLKPLLDKIIETDFRIDEALIRESLILAGEEKS